MISDTPSLLNTWEKLPKADFIIYILDLLQFGSWELNSTQLSSDFLTEPYNCSTAIISFLVCHILTQLLSISESLAFVSFSLHSLHLFSSSQTVWRTSSMPSSTKRETVFILAPFSPTPFFLISPSVRLTPSYSQLTNPRFHSSHESFSLN